MAFDPETELLCGVLPVFFFLLALGLWRRSRFAALTGLVLSLAVLGSGLSELPEAAMLHLAAGGRLLPLSLFAVVAVLGAWAWRARSAGTGCRSLCWPGSRSARATPPDGCRAPRGARWCSFSPFWPVSRPPRRSHSPSTTP